MVKSNPDSKPESDDQSRRDGDDREAGDLVLVGSGNVVRHQAALELNPLDRTDCP